MRFLEPADVVAAAAQLAGGGADALGAADLGALEAALARVAAADPADPPEAAALVFAELARSRPFPSSNLAVAWLAACQLLSLNDMDLPGAADEGLTRILGQVAGGADVDLLVDWIEARCPAPGQGGKGVRMFERFSDTGRDAIQLAREEARGLGHDFLGTEHLLLGLVGGEEGPAVTVLAQAGVTAPAVRDGIVSVIGPSSGPGRGLPRLTPRTKKVLELSLREAVRVRSRSIGPEHVLLAIIREGSGVATAVLEDLGVDPRELRRDVLQAMGGIPTVADASGSATGDLGAVRQRVLTDIDTLTGRIRELESECERLRGILRRHGVEPDGGERSA